MSAFLLRTFFSLVLTFILLAVLIFLPAGDILWPGGWLFLVVFLLLIIIGVAYLRRANPEIFFARSRFHPGTKTWDKVLVAFLLLSLAAIFPIAALDTARFHWSNLPLWLIGLGYLFLCTGFFVSIWVYKVNKFAEPGVRIQTERGQKVIQTGPYAIVRHPLYSASIIMVSGMALSLGSLCALIPVGAGTIIIVVRTILEDKLLQNELQGYKEYAARVRFRLIPGLW